MKIAPRGGRSRQEHPDRRTPEKTRLPREELTGVDALRRGDALGQRVNVNLEGLLRREAVAVLGASGLLPGEAPGRGYVEARPGHCESPSVRRRSLDRHPWRPAVGLGGLWPGGEPVGPLPSGQPRCRPGPGGVLTSAACSTARCDENLSLLNRSGIGLARRARGAATARRPPSSPRCAPSDWSEPAQRGDADRASSWMRSLATQGWPGGDPACQGPTMRTTHRVVPL